MSLDHILLGMLSTPAAGYDLGHEFQASARLFWSAELSQIYPTLRRLERAGLLTSEKVPSERGPDRRVYRRTPAGTAEVAEWLRSPPELGRLRLPHVAQFFFLGELDDLEETARFVRALREDLEKRLRAYGEIDRLIREESGDPATFEGTPFHHYATLRQGVLTAEARLAWCDETLAAIETRTGGAATPSADAAAAAAAAEPAEPAGAAG